MATKTKDPQIEVAPTVGAASQNFEAGKESQVSVSIGSDSSSVVQNIDASPSGGCVPPKPIKRNEFGLIEGVSYIFDEDGFVDWRKMIPSKYLYLNPAQNKRADLEKKYGKSYEQITVEEADDSDLVITLGGIKHLANLRGYTSVVFEPISANELYSGVSCSIGWIGNYETNDRYITFESTACAHPNNTNGFGKIYLLEMAENRSFSRAVRNFLRINIVSQAEISNNTQSSSLEEEVNTSVTPQNTLKRVMKAKGVDFAFIKKRLIEKKAPGAENYGSVEDIPARVIHSIIAGLNKPDFKKD